MLTICTHSLKETSKNINLFRSMNMSGHPIAADRPGSPSSLPEASRSPPVSLPGTVPSCLDLPAHVLLPLEALRAGPHVGQGPPAPHRPLE